MKKGHKKWLIVALLAAAATLAGGGSLSPEIVADLAAEVLGGAP